MSRHALLPSLQAQIGSVRSVAMITCYRNCAEHSAPLESTADYLLLLRSVEQVVQVTETQLRYVSTGHVTRTLCVVPERLQAGSTSCLV